MGEARLFFRKVSVGAKAGARGGARHLWGLRLELWVEEP